ncbi:bidirectional hydrogenase complex protein HoxU [Candidatus Poribacteria bacterium]|nr:bidirectional hydrogenase complex protein HoxU [Candidatus Poribacteria bacterium]
MIAVTLTIDDRLVSAGDDDTILHAAHDAGIAIPTLCHFEGIADIGACRLCLVEIEGSPKLFAACTTRVTEGMVVRTDTERLRRHRKLMIELMLSERNHVCSVCVANGHCELQDRAIQAGVDHVRVEYLYPKFTMDLSHKRYGADPNRCILCARCVRVCDEVEGAHTWDIGGRGIASHVVTDLSAPWGDSATCTACGKCVTACPTGALFSQGATVGELEKDRSRLAFVVTARKTREWVR